jgi:uncharacterized protein YhdP
MLEMRKMVLPLEASDLMALEVIITDADEREALRYLKKTVYDRLLQEQQGWLKSHLDGGKAAEGYARGNR